MSDIFCEALLVCPTCEESTTVSMVQEHATGAVDIVEGEVCETCGYEWTDSELDHAEWGVV